MCNVYGNVTDQGTSQTELVFQETSEQYVIETERKPHVYHVRTPSGCKWVNNVHNDDSSDFVHFVGIICKK